MILKHLLKTHGIEEISEKLAEHGINEVELFTRLKKRDLNFILGESKYNTKALELINEMKKEIRQENDLKEKIGNYNDDDSHGNMYSNDFDIKYNGDLNIKDNKNTKNNDHKDLKNNSLKKDLNKNIVHKHNSNNKHETKQSRIRFSMSSRDSSSVSKEITNKQNVRKLMSREKMESEKELIEQLKNLKIENEEVQKEKNQKNGNLKMENPKNKKMENKNVDNKNLDNKNPEYKNLDNKNQDNKNVEYKNLENRNSRNKIRVVIRKKPSKTQQVNLKIIGDSIILEENKLKKDLDPFIERHTFKFDKIFSENTGNRQIFNESMKDIVDDFKNDVSGTVICYGQTGTGKTYTLFGADGLLELSLKMLIGGNEDNYKKELNDESNNNFDKELNGEYEGNHENEYKGHYDKELNDNHENELDDECKESNYRAKPAINPSCNNYTPFKISFYEIYNGRIYDLLNYREKIEMREYEGNVVLKDLTCCKVKNFNEAIDVIKRGLVYRKTGVTGANNESSRSHAIIKIARDAKKESIGHTNELTGHEIKLTGHEKKLTGHEKKLTGEEFNIQKFANNTNLNKNSPELVFVDLAGSERGNDRKNVNMYTKNEGAEINKSLLALKECIRGVDLKNPYLPFRHSKLTQILKKSFMGTSRTLVIATVSGEKNDTEHTLNTLRYAFRIKDIHGEPRDGYKNEILECERRCNDAKNYHVNSCVENQLKGFEFDLRGGIRNNRLKNDVNSNTSKKNSYTSKKKVNTNENNTSKNNISKNDSRKNKNLITINENPFRMQNNLNQLMGAFNSSENNDAFELETSKNRISIACKKIVTEIENLNDAKGLRSVYLKLMDVRRMIDDYKF